MGGILSHFTLALQMMGVSIVSMGGILLGASLNKRLNLAIWALATITGILSIFKLVTLSSIALVDALFVALICSLILRLYEIRFAR